VDEEGNTLDFVLRTKRDSLTACRLFRKILKTNHLQTPRIINVDKNPALSCAIDKLNVDGSPPSKTVLRQD
jgi:transposase-like protein